MSEERQMRGKQGRMKRKEWRWERKREGGKMEGTDGEGKVVDKTERRTFRIFPELFFSRLRTFNTNKTTQ